MKTYLVTELFRKINKFKFAISNRLREKAEDNKLKNLLLLF